MKDSRLIILLFTGIFVMASCSSGQKYSMKKLKTREDTASYYLGVAYGNSMKQENVDHIFQADAFGKGVNDAIESDTMPVPLMEIQLFLNTFFSEIQQEQQTLKEEQLALEYEDYIAENKAFLAENATKDSVVTLPNGLQYVIMEEGFGPRPTGTDEIKFHYTGWLIDGTKFDSSYDNGEPAVYPVNGLIPGWSEIIKMMPVGSKWKVWIPAELAYGSNSPQGSNIIPFSTLVFEIDLIEINTEE